MTQDILKTTLQGLLKVLRESRETESEKLSDYEKYPNLESEEKGNIKGWIEGLGYAITIIKSQLDMIELAEDFTGSREC
tara:strand:+ start:105 stop:341 length:237 start_codon:yes stop_codon:yes gene_type:complete